MVPGEILCGNVSVCRETTWETSGKMGNALQGEGYPRTLYRGVVGWVSLNLCVNVCVTGDLRCTAPTLQLLPWLQLQPCDTGRPVGIAFLVCSSLPPGLCL